LSCGVCEPADAMQEDQTQRQLGKLATQLQQAAVATPAPASPTVAASGSLPLIHTPSQLSLAIRVRHNPDASKPLPSPSPATPTTLAHGEPPRGAGGVEVDAHGPSPTHLVPAEVERRQQRPVDTDASSVPVWSDTTDPAQRRPHHSAPKLDIAPAQAHKPAAALPLREEMRRVAEEHRGAYAPGHVPQWLEDQTGRGQRGARLHPSNDDDMSDLLAKSSASRAPRLHGRTVEDGDEQHRWLLRSLLTIWILGMLIALARWFRVCGGRRVRRRRPGEKRTDVLHRY